MTLLEEFLAPSTVSLKICGVTTEPDARRLIEMEVEAMGVNFWPNSKRYAPPKSAEWLKSCAGLILRVGVFVNPDPEYAIRLVEENFIDIVQLHGDETPQDAVPYLQRNIPFIKAIGVRTLEDAERAMDFGANAVLLDAHAPGVYGGTGSTFDWHNAVDFLHRHPNLPLVLAGGITPENAAEAAQTVRPAALDVASGAEISPGIKDFEKIRTLLHALH